MQIRVYYEDTDAGGVVYHSNYLNYCERARSEKFFAIGMTPNLQDGHFVARKLEADYKLPAKLGDVLEVTTKLISKKSASFIILHRVLKGDILLFEMSITLAYITFEGKPQRMDEELKKLLISLF